MSERVESTGTATERGEHPDSIWRNLDFVRLFVGRLVTNAGDSLYSIAMMWLVFDLTQSTFYTGLASSLLLLPHAIQFISGPLVDRWPLTRSLVWTQVIQGVVVLVLPLAAYAGHLSVGLILATIPVLALLNQFVYPAQAAALPRIVSEKQLTRGNSALSSVTQGLDMLFEAFGGLFIAVFGAVSLFIVDAGTFALATVVFLGMTIPPAENAADDAGDVDVRGYLADLTTGVTALRGTLLAEILVTTAVSNFAVGVALATLPAFGSLRGGPEFYGLLLAALGGGRFLGAVAASRMDGVPYGALKLYGFAGAALLWVGSVYAASPVLAAGLFALAWIPAGMVGVLGSTLWQTVVPNHLLGRVSSVSSTVGGVPLPVGALAGGIVASTLGVVTTMALAAAGFGFSALYFAARPPLRNIPAVTDVDPAEFDVNDPTTPADEAATR